MPCLHPALLIAAIGALSNQECIASRLWLLSFGQLGEVCKPEIIGLIGKQYKMYWLLHWERQTTRCIRELCQILCVLWCWRETSVVIPKFGKILYAAFNSKMMPLWEG